LIGFSLGAHIAGYVGEQVPNLGRITALDAAKPYFDGLSTEVRLNPSDALLVDAIHTDNGIEIMNIIEKKNQILITLFNSIRYLLSNKA
jgi:pancreatic triacylglycerol lipase